MQDVTLLRQALPYMREFRNRVFVVKFGGEAMADPSNLAGLAEDVALLHFVGIRVVLVHGGGAQVTELAKTLGIETRFVGGRRITDEATIGVLKMILAGKMNVDIVSALKRHGVRGIGFSGVAANIIDARKRPPAVVSGGGPDPVDFGFVGDIRAVDATPLHMMMDSGLVPVLAPLSADPDGNVLNINADVVAARVAAELRAAKLILMTSTPGVMGDLRDATTLISELKTDQAISLIRQGIITGGMIPKVEESIKAIDAGVEKVHIISAVEPHQLLLEIFTEAGCGTMITP